MEWYVDTSSLEAMNLTGCPIALQTTMRLALQENCHDKSWHLSATQLNLAMYREDVPGLSAATHLYRKDVPGLRAATSALKQEKNTPPRYRRQKSEDTHLTMLRSH